MDKTDATLKRLEKNIKDVYTAAYKEMRQSAAGILEKIQSNPDMPLAQKMALWTRYNRLDTLVDQLSNAAQNANKTALSMIENDMLKVYDLNYNGDAAGLGFAVLDQSAIKKILTEEENPFTKISTLKDRVAVKNKMKGQLMTGLLKGEGIPQIAGRLKSVSEGLLSNAVRIARTETTRVQNSAKMDLAAEGERRGFAMVKTWHSTADTRTRPDHVHMNGVTVGKDEPFTLPDGSKLMFPGDISLGADASETINCRCTMVVDFKRDTDGNLVFEGNEEDQAATLKAIKEEKTQELKDLKSEIADKKFAYSVDGETITVDQYLKKKDYVDGWVKDLEEKVENIEKYKEQGILSKYELKWLEQKQEFLKEAHELQNYANKYSSLNEEIRSLDKQLAEIQFDNVFSQERKDNALWFDPDKYSGENEAKKEADNVFRSQSGEVWKNASIDTRQALNEYTGEAYKDINSYLRGIDTDISATKKEQIKLIEDAISKSVSKYDVWLNRGISSSGASAFLGIEPSLLKNATEEELQRILISTTPVERGFMSTSSVKGSGFDGVKLNIFTPKGTPMIYAEPFSAFGKGQGSGWDGKSSQNFFSDEFETIIQRGAKFNITKVEKDRYGNIFVDMDLIGFE